MTLEIKRSIAEVAGSANGSGDKCGTQSGAAIPRPHENSAKLRDVDVPHEGLESIAAATLHDRALATNPKPIADAEPILSVLREAW